MSALLTPEVPMVNAGLYYVNGLQLSTNSVAGTLTALLTVAPGACRDSTNTNDIMLPSTVQSYNPLTGVYTTVNATYVINLANKGALGLDTGAIAANTMYAVYAIGSSTNQVGNGQPLSAYPGTALISLSFTQPTLPAGYDMFKRIGTVVTNGTSTVVPFTQTGVATIRRMTYQTPLSTGTTAGAAADLAVVNPNGGTIPTLPPLATVAYFNATYTPTAEGDTASLSPSSIAGTIASQLSGSVTAVAQIATMSSQTTAVPQLYYQCTGTLTLTTLGFDDLL